MRGRPVGRRSTVDKEEPPPDVADVQALSLEPERRLVTRHAGIFFFLPLLARLGFDRLVRQAGYSGTQMVPAVNALLSLLTLKLLDKERLSHIDDFNCDEALGMFAGLNILPKKSFATDYRWLASQLHGFDRSKPKALYRKFVETSGAVEVEQGRRIVVYLDRRSHNPILREAHLDEKAPPIPWLQNHTVEFVHT